MLLVNLLTRRRGAKGGVGPSLNQSPLQSPGVDFDLRPPPKAPAAISGDTAPNTPQAMPMPIMQQNPRAELKRFLEL